MTDRPKRPRDANQLAKFIVDVATGDVTEKLTTPTQHRQAGSLGGQRRAETLSDLRKKEIAQKAASARWAKSALPSEGE